MLVRMCAASLLLVCGLQAEAGEVTVVGPLFHSHVTASGGFAKGSVEVQNNTDQVQSVLVYQTDYGFEADGSNRYGDVGSETRSNGSWIGLSTEQIELMPAETREVHYSSDVPDDATLLGTYWSMIMIEGGSLTEIEEADEDGEIVIGTRFRYGIQVVNNMPGNADLSALGVGLYTALVVVDAGNDGVVGSQYTLELR